MDSTTPTSPGFVHDGRTTYCWRIPASYTVKQPKWSDSVLPGGNTSCPLSMELNLAATEVVAGTFVAVNWTVQLEKARFVNSANALRQGAIVRVPDMSTGFLADVAHSNIHSCAFGSNCDPFRDGTQFVDNTPNKVGNFSASGSIVFTSQQELLYPTPGIYSVLAHIIIAGMNASDRFDYAVYQRLTVKEPATPPPGVATTAAPNVRAGGADASRSDVNSSSSSSTALSDTAITVIVVGVVLALALVLAIVVVVLRSRRAKRGAVPEISPRDPPRPLLAPFEKPLRQGGYSELSSIPPLRPAPLPLSSRSNYLSSADPEPVRRAGEMDIRDFDSTFEQTTSYQFVPDDTADRDAARTDRRPYDIVDSTFSVDFVYPDATTTELLVAQRRLRRGSDEFHYDNNNDDDSVLDTNDSYGPFAAENLSIASSRVFSDTSELSESIDGGERFSDATDSQDVEL